MLKRFAIFFVCALALLDCVFFFVFLISRPFSAHSVAVMVGFWREIDIVRLFESLVNLVYKIALRCLQLIVCVAFIVFDAGP